MKQKLRFTIWFRKNYNLNIQKHILLWIHNFSYWTWLELQLTYSRFGSRFENCNIKTYCGMNTDLVKITIYLFQIIWWYEYTNHILDLELQFENILRYEYTNFHTHLNKHQLICFFKNLILVYPLPRIYRW